MLTVKNNRKGFTLIEIVIVIVIIAILAAILVPNIIKWVDKAKLARLKSEADTVRNSVAAYVTHEMGDKFDQNVVTDENITTFVEDFWSGASSAAGTTLQNTDPNSDGYVTFKIDKGIIDYITFHKDGHTASYDGSVWTYE